MFKIILHRLCETLLCKSQGKRSFLNLHIHIYKNKGFNFNMNVIHSAPTKKSLSKSFFGLQPSGFRLPQAETFFYQSHSNFLQYNNPLIKKFQRKLIELTKIRSGDKSSFTSQP